MFDTTIAQFGFHVLLQSTLLIAAGFLAMRGFARRKPVVQSVILRVTLIAVFLCPLASLALSEIGVTEFALLPAWESPRTTPVVDSPQTTMIEPPPAAEREQPPTLLTETIIEQAPELLPSEESGLLAAAPSVRTSPSNPATDRIDKAIAPVQLASSESGSRGLMPRIGQIVSMIWVTGAFVLLAKLILANLSVVRLRRTSRAADAEVRELGRQTSQTLGLPAPEIRVSGQVHSPCLIGIRKPVILLPERETFSQPVLRDVFLHELAHLSRRDCLFHLLARLATSALFFQPLVWLLARRLEQIADDICDDYVIQYGQDRKSYAHTLVNFAEQLPTQWTVAEAGLGMVSLRSSLSRRVLRILDSTRSLTLRLNTGWIVMIVLLGISATTSAALLINARSVTVAEEQDKFSETQSDPKNQSEAKPSDSDQSVTSEEKTSRDEEKQTADPTFHFRGKVVGPDGNPVTGATLNYTHWNRSDNPHLATVDAQGAFEFSISPSDQFYEFLREEGGTFVAMAEGYGPAVKSAHECETTGEMLRAFQRRYEQSPAAPSVIEQTLKRILSGTPAFQLVRDDVPLTGRVVDIDGQPVAGAILKVAKLVDGGRGGLEVWEEQARKPGTDYYQLQQYQGMNLGNDVGGTTLNYIPPSTTDENGRFTFKGIGRDRIAKLLISGPGIATSRVYARTRAGDVIEVVKEARRGTGDKIVYHPANFTHVAGPSLPVEGIVRDAKTQQPMPGVTLQSYRLAGIRVGGWTEGIVQTTTDEQGRYRLEGLPIGENEVLCLSSLDEPYIVSKFTAETKAGGEVMKKDLELTRGIWIEGRAHDLSTGEPIRSGRVEYFVFTDNPFAKTVQGFNGAHLSTRHRLEPDGTYRIPGLPGRGIVAVMADRDHQKYQRGMGADKIEGKEDGFDGYRTYPYIISSLNFHVLKEINPAEDAESVQLDFEFDSGRSLEVRVVDREGNPVIGGRYDGMMETMNNWDPIRGNTLKINGYRPDKPRRVQVFHKERKLVGFLVLEGENPDSPTVTLEPWATISGRLLDEAGVPKADTTIGDVYQDVMHDPNAAKLPPNINQETGQYRGYVTDKDGRFTIAGIVPGKPLRLSVTELRRNGVPYGLGEFSIDAELKPGEVRDLGDVKLEPRRGE